MEDRGPIGVGGVGGSGTRVVAEILQRAGLYLGSDLNKPLDNLSFGLLFANPNVSAVSDEEFRQRTAIYCALMYGDRPLDAQERALVKDIANEDWPLGEASWFKRRAARLLESSQARIRRTFWGWKAPPTHVVLGRLAAAIPEMKYVHVMRNGLDMAFSSNQNQLKIYGPLLFGDEFAGYTPEISLKYWRIVNERAIKIGQRLGRRFLLLKLEELCVDPTKLVSKILSFAGMDPNRTQVEELSGLVRTPTTIGRHKASSYDKFDESDVAYVKRHFGSRSRSGHDNER